jgi:hypothetical protein
MTTSAEIPCHEEGICELQIDIVTVLSIGRGSVSGVIERVEFVRSATSEQVSSCRTFTVVIL